MIETSEELRSIRSYVRRESRITPAQRRALRDLWPRYGIDAGDACLDFDRIYGRSAPVILEIGFGDGEALAAAAAAHPELNFLGVEVHRPGVGRLLRRLQAEELLNVRVVVGDVRELLAQRIADASLFGVQLFFPDPWPKKRHHKRRLVQPEFAALVARRLVPGGFWHLATDWTDYAEHMRQVLSRTPGLEAASGLDALNLRVANRPATRFERRGRTLGHSVRDLVFRRTG